IYSQLPLPLGTLPRFDGIAPPPQTRGTQTPWRRKDREIPSRRGRGRRVYGGSRGAKSTNTIPQIRPQTAKLPLSSTRDTSLPMNNRDRKPPFRRGGGKGRPSAPRPAWRDRVPAPDGPFVLYGWHTVTMALANPERQIRRLLLTETAARRLEQQNIATRFTPEIVRP